MKNTRKILSILLVIIWMIVIFIFSSKNSNESNKTSLQVIDHAVTETIEITKVEVTKEEKAKIVKDLNFPVRKLAHASIYFVLSLLLINMFYSFKAKHIYIYSILVSFIYALTDEFHQSFIDGRTSSIIDSFIDTFGAILAVIIFILIKRVVNKHITKK